MSERHFPIIVNGSPMSPPPDKFTLYYITDSDVAPQAGDYVDYDGQTWRIEARKWVQGRLVLYLGPTGVVPC